MCFVVRGCPGCLGAATTTNYSDSSCAGVRLRLDRFWSSDELQTAPIVAKHLIFYCKNSQADVLPSVQRRLSRREDI